MRTSAVVTVTLVIGHTKPVDGKVSLDEVRGDIVKHAQEFVDANLSEACEKSKVRVGYDYEYRTRAKVTQLSIDQLAMDGPA